MLDKGIMATVNQLVLITKSGLCNRMRAIASARKLCSEQSARCELIWDWGRYEDLFKCPSDLIIIEGRKPSDIQITHKPTRAGGSREIPIQYDSIELISNQIFWASGHAQETYADIAPWICNPTEEIWSRVNQFAAEKFNAPIVGMHVRRTDNLISREGSPSWLFKEIAAELVAEGKRIFLCSDCPLIVESMKLKFGSSIVTLPKTDEFHDRWPRLAFDLEATKEDLTELFLLSRTDYVVGSFWSSYSQIAIALNKSKECRIAMLDKAFKKFIHSHPHELSTPIHPKKPSLHA